MPEYLSPGVYVEEVDAGTQRIPGISTSIDRARWQSLVAKFKEDSRAPGSGLDRF